MKRFLRWAGLILLIVIALAVSGFVVWGSTPARPDTIALSALQNDNQVQVTEERGWIFQPKEKPASTGVIFYPGGRVDPRAYAPLAHQLAAAGYWVKIVPMPLNLAVLGIDRAEDVVIQQTSIQNWVIGGHSLGGAMAAEYVKNHPQDVDGLFFLAAYPADSTDLSAWEEPVLSISAENDGLATAEKIDASRRLLPASTTWLRIAGGNHAQFGSYGVQSGDGTASISAEEQLAQTATALINFLKQVEQGE